MSALTAIVALPVAAVVIAGLLRTRLAALMVKAPTGDRWRMDTTPFLGGAGIFTGLVVGTAAAAATGAVATDERLFGILGGCGLLFAAGLLDDLRHLSPLAKLGAQFAAAGLVLATGTRVELIDNPVAATALALVWLVGMTNAFNLLDNMDGLAATLAGIAAAFFAIDAVTIHPDDAHLAFALAIAFGCAGFLPFNLRRHGKAAVFMGDSGSQTLGFALAALGLSASWNVAGTTVATLALPILILAVPILDTTLVTIVRLLEGRPVTQGGKDHSSHRLVSYGLSEKHAVALLALVATALGTTSLAYSVLDNQRIALVGVLLTFILLVQFGSFLADLERRPVTVDGSVLDRFAVHWRRFVEVIVDFVLIAGAFTASFLIVSGGTGTTSQRHLFTVTLPVLIAARYVAFVPFGLYRNIWRYAGARDAMSVAAAVVVSEAAAAGFIALTRPLGDFPLTVFVLDALLCTAVIGSSRLAERVLVRTVSDVRARAGRRTVIVGAGRAGRSLHRELRETPGERVVGFLDDNPQLHRRRLQGVPILGTLQDVERVLARTRADRVIVTIPDAPRKRLDPVVAACGKAGVECRFARRELDLDPHVALGAVAPERQLR